MSFLAPSLVLLYACHAPSSHFHSFSLAGIRRPLASLFPSTLSFRLVCLICAIESYCLAPSTTLPLSLRLCISFSDTSVSIALYSPLCDTCDARLVNGSYHPVLFSTQSLLHDPSALCAVAFAI